MLLGRYKIFGHSMEPKIKDGSYVLVSCIFYIFKKPVIGDIVAFNYKNKIFIKRVTKINEGKYFMSGDNKKDSLDGTNIGLVSKKEILGKVFYIFI